MAALVLVSPIACLVLFVLSVGGSRPPAFRRRCAGAVFVVPVAALVLYAIYEAGIPSEYNIRVDLLLIYPALAVDFVFWIALVVRYLIGRRS